MGVLLKRDGGIECWFFGEEENNYGQANPPDGVFVSTDSGPHHTCAFDQQSDLHCWGRNDVGQSDVPEGIFTQVSVGLLNTCALTSTGEMTCWGNVEGDSLWNEDADNDGFHKVIDCDDNDPMLNRSDFDQDGLTSCDGDCDDQDASHSHRSTDGTNQKLFVNRLSYHMQYGMDYGDGLYWVGPYDKEPFMYIVINLSTVVVGCLSVISIPSMMVFPSNNPLDLLMKGL